MLGFITPKDGSGTGRGLADRLLADVAQALAERGWPLAGVIQTNPENSRNGPCHMDIHVLSSRNVIRISQDLGTRSRGCRLDAGALAHAVGLAEAALATPARMVIVNKFGKQEIEGRGFRFLIAEALSLGIPVLTAVGKENLPAFRAFAAGHEQEVDAELGAILAWVDAVAPPCPASA